MSSPPNVGNQCSLSLYELDSDFDTEEYEAMRETFRDTWRMKHGTKFISFSEKTLGENLATVDQYERILNYMFLAFFVFWLVNIVFNLDILAFASCVFLWIGIAIIILNLRFGLIKFQLESVEFCYLIFSAVFTFCVAGNIVDWDLSFVAVRFTYYVTFIFIILFDCLEDKFRRTSKWVLFIGGLSFLINALRIQFTSKEVLEEELGYTVRQFYLGKEVDSWTNLAVWGRMNFVQSFFCFKMFYHLHNYVDYSYFITERRKNENFNQFSLHHDEDIGNYAANTFRSYAAFMEKMERKKSRSTRTPKSVRVVAPSEVIQEMSDKFSDKFTNPVDELELTRTKSDPTRIVVQLTKENRRLSTRASLTVTVTNQENVSETIIGPLTPKLEAAWAKSGKEVTFAEGVPTGETIRSNQSDMYAAWIPRETLIKFFNFCAVSLLVLHIVSLAMPMLILDILSDFCIVAMGSIIFLNLKFEYYKIIMYDVEYIYLMLSCVAAFYLHCDVYDWRPVRVFRNSYTWFAFASFAHFDLLVNEMKKTLKWVLGFLVLSIWLLYASYLMTDEEDLEKTWTIRSYNISENDQYTNLELWTRICLIMSFFWLKLAYHLWYYFEYFYYNRLLIKLNSFLDTSTVAEVPISPSGFSQMSKGTTPSHTPRASVISVTPDNQLTE